MVGNRLWGLAAVLAVGSSHLPLPTAAAGQKAAPRPLAKAAASSARKKAPRVLGKLAIVHVGQATLRGRPEPQGRVLSTVPRNTYLAVTGSQGAYYGVLMINRTTGWVLKSQVRITPYQMAMSGPGKTAAAPTR